MRNGTIAGQKFTSIGLKVSEVNMTAVQHLSMTEMEAELDHIRRSPKDAGTLALIVRRPAVDEREVLQTGELSLGEGLVGDNWGQRPNPMTPDGSPHPEMQLNIMNARAIALLAGSEERWQLAGDQLFVDLDLSDENIPPGTRLSLGEAVIEITAVPHTGCKKFAARFGKDAVIFVNTGIGKELHLRGVNAKVVHPGAIRVGDVVRKC
jgi:hypothetical protein